MIPILEIAVSVIFFANKVFVVAAEKVVAVVEEERVGWFLGAIAAALATVYFYLIDLYIFTVLEIGLVILMGYGAFKKERTRESVEWFIRIAITVVMVVLTYFVFAGFLTIMEFFGSIYSLWGTYFLTHNRRHVGWYMYAIGHVFSTVVGYGADQHFFAHFQIASCIVAIVGVVKTRPRAVVLRAA